MANRRYARRRTGSHSVNNAIDRGRRRYVAQDRTFKKTDLLAFWRRLAVGDLSVAFYPNVAAAKRRYGRWSLLTVEDGFIGNVNVLPELGVKVEPGVSSLGRFAHIPKEQR